MVGNYSVASDRPGPRPGMCGLVALSLPVLVMVAVVGTMDGGLDGLVDPAAQVAAGLLLLVAIPTTWVFALFDLPPVFTLVLGCVTSLPLWFALGTHLGRTTDSHGQWIRRYLGWFAAWAVISLLVLLTIASIIG